MMAASLIALDEFMRRMMARLPPAPLERLPPAQAIGRVAAEDIVAPSALPRANIALRAGLAVAASDTVGASIHSPVLLSEPPVSVAIGDALPSHCDAIADPQTVTRQGAFAEIMEPLTPGQYVRLAGHDLRKDHLLARKGELVTAATALACALSALADISVFKPSIFIAPHDNPARHWLVQALAAQGAVIVDDPARCLLHIEWDAAQGSALALAPGGAISLMPHESSAALSCPPRFDSIFALYAAILLPCLAQMTHRSIHVQEQSVTRKISSAIGMSEVVIFRSAPEGMIPLATGDITLDAWLQADTFCILPPHSEGVQAGTSLSVTPLHAPLTPVQSR